jgi:hypothetical protein
MFRKLKASCAKNCLKLAATTLNKSGRAARIIKIVISAIEPCTKRHAARRQKSGRKRGGFLIQKIYYYINTFIRMKTVKF